MNHRRRGLLSLIVFSAGTFLDASAAVSPSVELRFAIKSAGNTDDDGERVKLLEQMRAISTLDDQTRAELEHLIKEFERWVSDKRLDYFGHQMYRDGGYRFQVDEASPLYPLTYLYRGRMIVWVTLESGNIWKIPNARRAQLDAARQEFEHYARHFPENRIARMYLGEAISRDEVPAPVENAPAWAAYQREGLEGIADIIHWWIRHRLQDDGQYGGGWGDDCEMWRWWVPVLIAFEDPEITAAQARFCRALWAQEHMAGGYTDRLYDVEHTAEDSADTLTPMMHLEPNNPEWRNRALRLVDLMESLWTGINERGQLQFKSTYFSADRVNLEAKRACDTVYHPRAIQPALLLWQRTGDARMGRLFTSWLDTWVDATARSERGKPAGVIPSAIHWPDGAIGGIGEYWWDPENHTDDPLYVWPSSMSMMLNTLLLAHHMTGEAKYLGPLQSMAQVRLRYLDSPVENPEPGSEAWCGSKLGGMTGIAAKYKLLTGEELFDDLLAKDENPYMSVRLRGDREAMTEALRKNAEALRINFEGYTSEVRYTDRVLRFPSLFGANSMYEKALPAFHSPDPAQLYSTATGDPDAGIDFPVNAVRWLTPPREIAALVTASGPERFEAELFHFGDSPREMGARLYLLKTGTYSVHVKGADDSTEMSVSIGEDRDISFTIPPRRLCIVRISPKRE